jgi:hypothetical protein
MYSKIPNAGKNGICHKKLLKTQEEFFIPNFYLRFIFLVL